MKKPKTIRVLLVDDHPIVREGIRSCLATAEHLEIVGEAGDGKDAITLAQKLNPDIILMDINLPVIDGMVATVELQKRVPKARVLALTAHRNQEYVARIVAAGAHGYVLKDASPQKLVAAIEAVHQGGTFFSPEMTNDLLRRFVGRNAPPAEDGAPSLTMRECEVLVHIAEGCSNKEIAQHLGVSVRTVETHRERLMEKLGIRSVAGLTKFAIAQGLVKLE